MNRYTYDKADNLTRKGDNDYLYDDLNRLIRADLTEGFTVRDIDRDSESVGYATSDFAGR